MARAGNKEPREWVAATVLGAASHLAEKQSKCAWEHVGHSDIQPCPSYILVLGLCAAMQPGIHKELLHRAILKDTPTHPGHTTQKKHTMRLKPWRKEPRCAAANTTSRLDPRGGPRSPGFAQSFMAAFVWVFLEKF